MNYRGEGITREELLKRAGAGALALSAGGLLAACGSNGGSTTAGAAATTGAAGGDPIRGGTLRVGLAAGGAVGSNYPGTLGGGGDFFMVQQVYDNLFNTSAESDLHLEPALCLSAEPNADATVWTLKLRDEVTWHDGKPFTADDVVYTFSKAWASPENYANGLVSQLVDLKSVRKLDRLTVEVPLLHSVASFPTLFTFVSATTWIVPAGYSKEELSKHPIGTGPFKFDSQTPGRQTKLSANRDYWNEGKPYVDGMVIDITFEDDTAQLNALLAGEIDVMTPFPYSKAKEYENGDQIQLLRSPGPGGSHLYMLVDRPPFKDNRVRQAMKLLLDRQQLVDNVLYGYGDIGNDIGVASRTVGVQYFADDLEPVYDPEKAAALLREAGMEGKTVTLETAEIESTFVPSATLIAQQAKAVGLNVNVKTQSPGTYYTQAGGYLNRSFGQNVQSGTPSLGNAYLNTNWAGAPFNLTHWGKGMSPGGAAADKLLFEALGEQDEAKASELWYEVQKQQYDEGGFISWGWGEVLDAVSPRVRGLQESPLYNLNGYRMLDGWIEES